MKNIAFIQARNGSARLPFKVLQYVDGKTILQRIIETCKASICDDVFVLTSNRKEDGAIVDLADRCGVKSFTRHDPNDVLTRFTATAASVGMHIEDTIVRVCGDSPLLAAATIDKLIRSLQPEDDIATYSIDGKPATIVGLGSVCEVIRLRALVNLAMTSPTQDEREHVTLGLYQRGGYAVRMVAIERPKEKESVDTLEDLKRIRRRVENGDVTRDENNRGVSAKPASNQDRRPNDRQRQPGVDRGRNRTES